MIINAVDYGVKPESNSGKALAELFNRLSKINEEKTLVFEKGNYYVDAADCDNQMLYITNTAGDKEYKKNETPHLSRAVINLKNVHDLKIEGNGAMFVINGMATNAAIQSCENIEINNIAITSVNPDLHELKVIGIKKHSVDFEVDENSIYMFENGSLYFTGTDYKINPIKKYRTAWHLARVRENTPDIIERTHNLFALAIRAKDLGNGKIRIYYLTTAGFEMGDRYCLFYNRRQYVGIFADQCKNITLNNISQHFNYALAFVAQNTENITLDGLTFAPDKKMGRLMASLADFLQICMCRGTVSITNSYFEGACDDCLNVHGVHFKITDISGNKIKVRFMHPQSHGYNPIRKGDEIAFINPKTLLESGTTAVVSSALIGEYEIELELSSTEKAVLGDVIEDVTACPELYFKNNTVKRIATRAVLTTNRPKTVVEGNRFISNSMSGISVSDDAASWFESGMCKEIVIKDNIFEYCGETPIKFQPENKVHGGAVHSNIKILNNDFRSYKGTCITMKSTDDVEIIGNKFIGTDILKTTDCNNIKTDFQ